METQIVERALEYVKQVFAREYSGHDYFHTLRVFKTATRIAEREGAELLTVQLAALLHDVDDHKLSPETWENKENARRFLAEQHMEAARIEEICRIIGEVSYMGSDSVIPGTPEGRCVQDADRLDAIGAIGIARAFAFGGAHHRVLHDPAELPRPDMDRETYKNHRSTTINHFYEKLLTLTELMTTATAKELALQRHRYMEDFLSEFMDEWEGRR